MVKVDLADAGAARRVPGDVDGVRVVTEVDRGRPPALSDGSDSASAASVPGGANEGAATQGVHVRIGIQASYSGGFQETAAEIRDLESAGLDVAMVAEVYTFDAVSQLGYLAAVTERVELMSGIFPIYSRTPALTAMTAAGLDFVSDGRFTLGLGRLRAAGHRGLARRPLRRPAAAHPGDRGDLPAGVAPGAARPPGQEVHGPAAGRPGHRAWASR